MPTTTTTTTATAATWDTVAITVNGHPLTLPAETIAPGLVLVPSANDTGWTGGYTVVHTPSGEHVGPDRLPLAYTRELSTALAAGGHDWTRDAHALRTDPVLRKHYFGTLLDLQYARDFGRPLWWARPSWRHVPPPWLLTAPGHDTWAVRTWADVVTEADRTPDGGPSFIPDHAVVTRPDRPEWELACAAPLCTHGPDHGPTVLTYWADDHGQDLPMHSPHRADLETEARDQHWRDHTDHHRQRWLCPTCADDHPRDHD